MNPAATQIDPVTGKIQRRNTDIALSIIQSARAGCTMDGTTDVIFDAVDAKQHLESGETKQEPTGLSLRTL
jgi:hypothetical protein